MTKQILFFDQKGTLEDDRNNLVPGVDALMKEQSKNNCECVITTSSDKAELKSLDPVVDFISRYYSKADIERISAKINGYVNPHHPNFPEQFRSKDLLLLKKIIALAEKKTSTDQHELTSAPIDHISAVMIGNIIDLISATTDPETPLIIVDSNKWAERQRTRLLLLKLFNNKLKPHEVFDQLFYSEQAEKITPPALLIEEVTSAVRIQLENETFIFGRNDGIPRYGNLKFRAILESPDHC